ncbi:MAG TPA: flagellar basal body L-ring protein FlgH [Ramlibacter sp.]|nr:flagellar basal body L-ring protein FlgH [Ramlibacter sp.]
MKWNRPRGALVVATALLLCAAAGAESLYREEAYRPLVGDLKARRVGDAVTVQVYESSSATSSTDTSTQRNNNINATVTRLPSRQRGFGISVNGDFDGGGTTQRANRLLATLTVTVREELPTGELRIGGEQLLQVNQELHRVNIEGRVRPQDISDGNVVLSTRIADARITYVGDGDLTERQRRGLWRQVMDWLGF